MKKDFEIRPDFVQVGFSGFLQAVIQQYQHPGRHTGEAAHIFFDHSLGNRIQFHFPVAHERNLAVGRIHKIGPKWQILNHDSRKIAEFGFEFLVNICTSSDAQIFSLENACIGMFFEIIGKHHFTTGKMVAFQRFVGHRNEFAFGVGRSGRFGKPRNFSRPENIAFALSCSFYFILKFLVGHDWHTFAIIFITGDFVKGKALTIGGFPGCFEVSKQHFVL